MAQEQQRGVQGTQRRGHDASTVYAAVPTNEQVGKERQSSARTKWWQRVLLDTWTPEFLAIILSAACVVAITTILIVYNGKTTPHLPYGITLNALVAILATASRSALLYTVASTIGQLKWCWFQQKRRNLQDMQVFDDASRGPWGSITLIFSRQIRPLASVCALVTTLALAFDPFAQQLLTYPGRVVPSGRAGASYQRSSLVKNPMEWIAAINAGIWSSPDQFSQRPVCPTGTCTWPTISSVGWCAKCVNATSYAKITNCNLTSIPDNHTIEETDTAKCYADLGHGNRAQLLQPGSQTTLNAMYDLGPDDRFMRYTPNPFVTRTAIWNLGSLDDRDSPDRSNYQVSNATFLNVTNPVIALAKVITNGSDFFYDPEGGYQLGIMDAEECVLSLCEREYNVSVTDGIVDEKVTSTTFGIMTGSPHNSVDTSHGPGLPDVICAAGSDGSMSCGSTNIPYWNFCWQSNETEPVIIADCGVYNSSAWGFCPSGLCSWASEPNNWGACSW